MIHTAHQNTQRHMFSHHSTHWHIRCFIIKKTNKQTKKTACLCCKLAITFQDPYFSAHWLQHNCVFTLQMNVCNLQAKCVKRQSLWCLISGCVCLCVCVRVCSVHRKMRCPGDEKGGPLNSQNDLNLNLQPLRGIDRILSYFDTTDLWCAICIIVHFMVFLFQEVTFLFFLFFFRSKVLFSFVECI